MVQGSGFRVQGSGFRVQGSGFRVQGLRVPFGTILGSPPRRLKKLIFAIKLHKELTTIWAGVILGKFGVSGLGSSGLVLFSPKQFSETPCFAEANFPILDENSGFQMHV